jgi:hypothetical protein
MYLVNYATRKSINVIVVEGFANKIAMLNSNTLIASY